MDDNKAVIVKPKNKLIRRLIIGLIILFIIAGSGLIFVKPILITKEHDFLDVDWGMSEKQIINIESKNNNKVYSRATKDDATIYDVTLLYTNERLLGWTNEIEYNFYEDKLVNLIVRFNTPVKEGYNSALQDFTNSLNNKYSIGINTKSSNSNDTSNYTNWIIDRTNIKMQYGYDDIINEYKINIYAGAKDNILKELIKDRTF
jgi:hypothetical protein